MLPKGAVETRCEAREQLWRNMFHSDITVKRSKILCLPQLCARPHSSSLAALPRQLSLTGSRFTLHCSGTVRLNFCLFFFIDCHHL